MKNLLLKITLAGLTLGLLPQGVLAMENNNPELNRPQARADFIATARSRCISIGTVLSKIGFICNVLTTLITYLKPQTQVGMSTKPTITSDITFPIALSTYANTLELGKNIVEINPHSHAMNSKKYGEIILISEELQDISSGNITILQPLSAQQNENDPYGLKYSFSNLFAIEQLYRNDKAINPESIAQQTKYPLKTIGLEERQWIPLGKIIPMSPEENIHLLLDYAQRFFPDNNIHIVNYDKTLGSILRSMFHTFSETERLIISNNEIIDRVIQDLENYGISHVWLFCGYPATALSIIRDKKNNTYSIVYVNSENIALEPHNKFQVCYPQLKNLITNLKNTIEQKLITNK